MLSTKFRNLHLWGCWWYCNKPSVASEITSLRLELLGTNFTYQVHVKACESSRSEAFSL